MKVIDVDKIDWQDGCLFTPSGEPIPIHHKIATIEMLRDWQPSCEEEIRADEIRKFAEWCKSKGYSCYEWRMLIEQYEKEQMKGESENV